MRIAVIGLGHMGGPMAANQAKAGREVVAFDLSAEALARAREAGCETANSVAEAVAAADAVVTMLPAPLHVRQVVTGQVIPAARPGALLIDCSTIDVETARAVHGAAKEAGFEFADAPVSGGMVGAKAATLAFMVGCEEQAFGRVEQVLAPMGRAVIRAGGPGAGQAAKLCNNLLLGVSMLGACEAFALAEKLGLDWDRFFEITSQSSGQCWAVTANCPVPGPVPGSPANRAYQPGFAAAMMLKDLRLARDAAAAAGAEVSMAAHAAELYERFDGLGFGGKDFSAVIQLLRGRLEELTA